MVSAWQRRRKSVVVGGVWPELGVTVSANNKMRRKLFFTLEAVKQLRFVAAPIYVAYSALAFPIF